ncbi:MAG: ABC transporter permease [Oscillospiraceae bacterium]|jgi:ABC-type dipeptide/oligopeptide/nickel transport system permease subunit|nr:ABC transporter permease [Oscillospiraceae bacterium]
MSSEVSKENNASLEQVNLIDKQDSRFGDMWYSFKKNKIAVVGLVIAIFLIFVAIFGKFFTPFDPNLTEQDILNPRPPSQEHWFGTDEQGRDIFSRIINGASVSIFVGVASVGFSLLLGMVLGAIAGYYGGKIDTIIMRFIDIILAIPSILLAMCLILTLGAGVGKIIMAIGFISIPQYARIIRGSILSEKENDYVEAARIVGCSDFSIIFKTILPNIVSGIIVRAALGISSAVLEVAALGYLGLGIKPPQAEWGTMLSESRKFVIQAPHTLLFPGLAITLTVLAFNLLGDGLRDVLDPKS